MRKILSPLCLVLALVAFIGGFGMLAVREPEENMELLQARVRGDEKYEEILERDLERRQWLHRFLQGGLFASGIIFTAAAFLTMKGSRRSTERL